MKDLGGMGAVLPGVLGGKQQKLTLGNLPRKNFIGRCKATENSRKS